jgi:hypothetical protein
MNTEARQYDDRINVDKLSSICCNAPVINASRVALALSQQSDSDFDRLQKIEVEQTKLRPHYLRFLDLEEEKKAKIERLRRTTSLIPDHLKNVNWRAKKDEFNEYIVTITELTLWEAMLAILEHTGEIQLFELQHVLEQFGKAVTRGAIESAIKTHPQQLQARTRGRERFVSLRR